MRLVDIRDRLKYKSFIKNDFLNLTLICVAGVDPGAGGLQKTSEGKQKIIERIDCSGAGDVDMSREVTPNSDGIIEGKENDKHLGTN